MRERLHLYGTAGNAPVLPMLLVLAALAAAVLMLAMVATDVIHTGGGSTPAWSGDQAPPGAVGLGPEHVGLRAGSSGN